MRSNKNMELTREERFKLGERISWIGILGNLLLTAIKAVVGSLSGSSALVADAVHSGSDVTTTTIVLGSLKISKRPPDSHHPYGHGRAEAIAAKILSLILIFVGLSMLWSAISDMMSGEYKTPGIIALWAIIGSIVTKELMFQYTVRTGKRINSPAVIADAWHHRSDAYSSVAAFFGVLGSQLGYPILDPLASGVVAGFIVWMGYKILRDSIDELMDTQPDKEAIDQIVRIAEEVDGVEHVDDVVVRKYGADLYVDLKASVNSKLSLKEAHQIAEEVESSILEGAKEVGSVLVHIDPYPDKHDKEVERESPQFQP